MKMVTITWRAPDGAYPVSNNIAFNPTYIGGFVWALLESGHRDISVSSVWEREVKS